MKEHQVMQGECISSIADQYGFFWSTVWFHAANATLRKLRDDPNTLQPGDIVTIPDKHVRMENVATGSTHAFKMKGVPVMFRMRFLWEDKPRAGEPFSLVVGGKVTNGLTDGDGNINVPIQPNAREGTLRVGAGEMETYYDLDFGHLNPVDDLTGVQARLNNLGFNCGQPDGSMNPETKAALATFQAKSGLKATGEPDSATRSKLVEAHGS